MARVSRRRRERLRHYAIIRWRVERCITTAQALARCRSAILAGRRVAKCVSEAAHDRGAPQAAACVDRGRRCPSRLRGHAAIQRLSTFAPDVIVLDLMMPHMTGYDVLDWLKQNALAIPVVVATTEDDSQALDLGAAVKLTKPFTLEQLLDGVAVALAPA
ncbi:MAG: response regulator [Deltaproteobacteria bacterium]|nr:MAG: response regulator [Deltaproteobacteria bacterium]